MRAHDGRGEGAEGEGRARTVVPPLRDAVALIDHEPPHHPGLARLLQPADELLRLRDALRRHEEQRRRARRAEAGEQSLGVIGRRLLREQIRARAELPQLRDLPTVASQRRRGVMCE